MQELDTDYIVKWDFITHLRGVDFILSVKGKCQFW